MWIYSKPPPKKGREGHLKMRKVTGEWENKQQRWTSGAAAAQCLLIKWEETSSPAALYTIPGIFTSLAQTISWWDHTNCSSVLVGLDRVHLWVWCHLHTCQVSWTYRSYIQKPAEVLIATSSHLQEHVLPWWHTYTHTGMCIYCGHKPYIYLTPSWKLLCSVTKTIPALLFW